MSETNVFVEHLSEEHLIVVPEDIRDLPLEQLETLMIAVHAALHGREIRRPLGVPDTCLVSGEPEHDESPSCIGPTANDKDGSEAVCSRRPTPASEPVARRPALLSRRSGLADPVYATERLVLRCS
jgi:hypothetical protein